MALQLRSKWRTQRNPSFLHLFSSSSSSSSSSSDPNGGDEKNESPSPPAPPSPPSYSSYFSDVKASLKQSSPPPRRISPSFSKEPSPFAHPKPSRVTSLEEIHKNLSEFRRVSVPPPNEKSPQSSSQTISFQELYKRHVVEKSDERNIGMSGTGKSGKLSFDSIRESLKQLQSSIAGNQTANERVRGQFHRGSKVLDPMSLRSFRESLKMQPGDQSTSSPMVLGGSESLPPAVFGKELKTVKEMESQTMRTEFVKMYNYDELGDKLRMLRPTETKGSKNWFSFEELNERLIKLREIETKEMESRVGGISFKSIKDSLFTLRMLESDKAKKSTMQRLDILGQLGGTPNFMLGTPKEHLVEKYFHPDNMSSGEKMKLELKKVRDEFKMSESDCGSTRVQVAQLTTKIKHLASVLHKKDKHSRKGLQAMLERRKKLLKYLRRTDWDSYCFVLTKLGLRDNPAYRQ